MITAFDRFAVARLAAPNPQETTDCYSVEFTGQQFAQWRADADRERDWRITEHCRAEFAEQGLYASRGGVPLGFALLVPCRRFGVGRLVDLDASVTKETAVRQSLIHRRL